ncbi:MAG: hypothetical protein JXR96_21075 [Deltaproteobacteria bacterium]|nr:hypothetical protein [Deltaproteobacteria bacterium]
MYRYLTLTWMVALLAIGVTVSSCGSDSTTDCVDDEDCMTGVCVDGHCVQCRGNEDCNVSGRCVNHECVPRQECSSSSDCDAGFCVNSLCMDCLNDSDCPEGQRCRDRVCVTAEVETCDGDASCNHHGSCDDSAGYIVCTCDEGWAGAYCDHCASGYTDYGDGECRPVDPCATDTICSEQHRACENDQGAAVCGDCLGGYHEQDGACVEDTSCGPDTCNGHGVCDDAGGVPVCTCDPAYAGDHCESCAEGYEDYGDGECRPSDPCADDTACAEQHRECANDQGAAVCGDCLAGYHDDGAGGCVIDETCGPNSCSGHGSCDDQGGTVTCTCDEGYAGAHCESCEAGYVRWPPDGDSCVVDACDPDPCSGPHQVAGSCEQTGENEFRCDCDAGYAWLDGGCVGTCQDGDGDGYGIGPACYGPDCDDTNEFINPAADEDCNGADDDCDDETDEDLPPRACENSNEWGTCTGTETCQNGSWDCDARTPAMEVCNGEDDDCDEETDEGVLLTFYRDSDGDSFGDPGRPLEACEMPTGYVEDDQDCDDDIAAINPDATEICNGMDDDCDDETDEDVLLTFYHDADSDGYGDPSSSTQACTAPLNYVDNNGDCNDSEPLIWEEFQIAMVNVSLDGGGATVTVDPGANVTVSLDYLVTQDDQCPSCIDELLFGLYAESYWHEPFHCEYIGIPDTCPGYDSGHVEFTVRAPRTPGDYQIRAGIAEALSCSSATNSYIQWVDRRDDVAGLITVRVPACSDGLHYMWNLSLNGAGPEITVPVGASVDFSAEYFATQFTSCPSCIDQIAVGIEGDAQICKDLNIPPLCPGGATGTMTGTLTAPDSPGTYFVKSFFAAHWNCSDTMAHYENAVPGREWTYGVIHVQ